MTYPTALVAALLALAGIATAGAALPTPDQLAAWDARFVPGKYRVEEYDVNVYGEPLAGSQRTKRAAQCLLPTQLQSISRSPVLTMVSWQCHPVPLASVLDDSALRLMMSCTGDATGPVHGLASVALSEDRKTILSTFVKFEPIAPEAGAASDTAAKEPRRLYGVGSRLTRVGACSDAEVRALMTPLQRLADEWARSRRPMAQEVAACLSAIDQGPKEAAYATCTTSLAQARTQPDTQAEVVLLQHLGLLTGYVHRDRRLGYYRQALTAAQRVHGPDAPEQIELLVNIALIVGHKDPAAAVESAGLLERAVLLGRSSRDRQRQVDAVFHHGLWVTALKAAGDPQTALAVARDAAAHAARVLGTRHDDTARAWATLAELQQAAGQLDAARASHVKALAVWKATRHTGPVKVTQARIDELDQLRRRGTP